ncbi:dATP/dGTP diphosphohydrolase domain-containing protein [Amycolatopsis sp. NPDC059027]|uniref:dATP/dGTP diphosphohydrolase domain-containing protein n=1 Tax=Amycolatopsis sp. NPDC059027 TaxID=3346709 RepID=UPI00366C30EA
MDDSGERKEFAGGGIRDGAVKAERFELLWNEVQPYDDQPMVEFARWMARGAEKYAARNWEQFEGSEALEHALGSLFRHVYKFAAGLTDEDHGSAIKFNVDAIKLIRWKAGVIGDVQTPVDELLTAEKLHMLEGPKDPEQGGAVYESVTEETADSEWRPGDIVEYNDYGSRFRGRLVSGYNRCWTGVVTEIYSKGWNLTDDMEVGDEVSFVEGHSTKVSDAPKMQYFEDEGWYYRWDGTTLTFVEGEGYSRSTSVYGSPDNGDFRSQANEIPVSEVPEWAR